MHITVRGKKAVSPPACSLSDKRPLLMKITFPKVVSDPVQKAHSNCSPAQWGQMELLQDQRWKMGGHWVACHVYRMLLYEEASQPEVWLRPIETDEKREGAFLLSAISCDCGPCWGDGTCIMISFVRQTMGLMHDNTKAKRKLGTSKCDVQQ